MENLTNEKLLNEVSDFDKLVQIHSYIKSLITSGVLPSTKFELEEYFKVYKTSNRDADPIFKFISDIYGCGELPKIVTDEEYGKLEAKELYRGSRDISHIASTLSSTERHYGWGLASSGMHSAEKFDQALSYTAGFNDGTANENLVLKFKIDTNKIISIKKFQKAFTSPTNSIFKETFAREKFSTLMNFLNIVAFDEIFDFELYLEMFSQDAGKLGIILGYDAINTENWHSITILNRGAMTVSKSEYNRIMKLSNKHGSKKKIENTSDGSQPSAQ